MLELEMSRVKAFGNAEGCLYICREGESVAVALVM
jgi:hypothetical protein